MFEDYIGGIITINSIEPHYFAGWTGGRKRIVPGLAGYKTITANHKLTLSPECQICRLEGNPVHDDLQEAFDMCMDKITDKGFFTFQFIVDSKATIHNLYAGNYSVFKKGVNTAKSIFQIPIAHNYDVVISVVYAPFDKTLYQSHKALENAKNALKKENSIFILISACTEGIGPDKFLEPFKNYPNLDNNQLLRKNDTDYQLGYHKTGKILEALEYADLMLYSEIDELASKARFKPIKDLNAFIQERLTHPDKQILLILDGCITVPIIKD